jgi:hypothetical protein
MHTSGEFAQATTVLSGVAQGSAAEQSKLVRGELATAMVHRSRRARLTIVTKAKRSRFENRNTGLLVFELLLGTGIGQFSALYDECLGSGVSTVDGAGRVQIRVKAPDATKVRLNFWSGPKLYMDKQQDGFWTITTPPLVPGFHYYTLVIDGAEVSDPNTHAFFGGGKPASGVEVPEPGSTYYFIRFKTCPTARSGRFGTARR